MAIAKGKLARGDSKKFRSSQYSASHKTIEMGIAGYAQRFLAQMLHSSTIAATAQPAPIMDK